jgi:diguanylate cyclase
MRGMRHDGAGHSREARIGQRRYTLAVHPHYYTASQRADPMMTERRQFMTNPLDWRPIDRHLLLGGLVMIAPLLFGGWLWGALQLAPDYLHHRPAAALLAGYVLHSALLGVLLLAGAQRRKTAAEWPLLENTVIWSFVLNTLASGYMTGTQFTGGLLIIFLGINIASALANIRKIGVAHLFTCAVMAGFAIINLGALAEPAPLFASPLLKPQGAAVTGWIGLQVVIAAVLLSIAYLSILAISRWVERENLYREMSTVDGLTRLTNRRSFIERGQSEFSRAQRMPPGVMACVMADLDHFKRINDTWGHHAGDQVLVTASGILMETTRQHDEVGRYGGEEFAILMPGISLEEALAAAERIRATIASTVVECDGHRISMTASFGVAVYPGEGIDSLNDLLKAADKALYVAKDTGRNRVVRADSSLPTT